MKDRKKIVIKRKKVLEADKIDSKQDEAYIERRWQEGRHRNGKKEEPQMILRMRGPVESEVALKSSNQINEQDISCLTSSS